MKLISANNYKVGEIFEVAEGKVYRIGMRKKGQVFVNMETWEECEYIDVDKEKESKSPETYLINLEPMKIRCEAQLLHNIASWNDEDGERLKMIAESLEKIADDLERKERLQWENLIK